MPDWVGPGMATDEVVLGGVDTVEVGVGVGVGVTLPLLPGVEVGVTMALLLAGEDTDPSTQYASPRIRLVQAEFRLGFQNCNSSNVMPYSSSNRPQ